MRRTSIAETYTSGYYLILSRDITNKDIASICRDLNTAFNVDGITEYAFAPEPISEGGIEMVSWPGKTGDEYKTMRIHFSSCGNWPFIERNNAVEFMDNLETQVIGLKTTNMRNKGRLAPGNPISTCLKAFDGAPVWTVEELDIFAKVFEQYGITCSGKIKPSSLTIHNRC